MCQSAVLHRALLVHLERPPLSRLLARSIYAFIPLVMTLVTHEENLLVSIAHICTACSLTNLLS